MVGTCNNMSKLCRLFVTTETETQSLFPKITWVVLNGCILFRITKSVKCLIDFLYIYVVIRFKLRRHNASVLRQGIEFCNLPYHTRICTKVVSKELNGIHVKITLCSVPRYVFLTHQPCMQYRLEKLIMLLFCICEHISIVLDVLLALQAFQTSYGLKLFCSTEAQMIRNNIRSLYFRRRTSVVNVMFRDLGASSTY